MCRGFTTSTTLKSLAMWEFIAFCLAAELFNGFKLLPAKPRRGPRGTQDAIERLFLQFRRYRNPRKGSKYKNFLEDHPKACAACKLKSDGALKKAMQRARKRYSADTLARRIYLRHATARALGVA